MQIPLPQYDVRLRPYHPADAPTLAHQANDREIWLGASDRFPHPYTLQHAEDHIAWALDPQNTSEFRLGIDVGGQAVGGITLFFQEDVKRRTAEIGYWLGRQHWGRGLATEAVKALTAYGFANYDLVRIYAKVFANNPASSKVLEKAGYVNEARLHHASFKNGELVDDLLYAIFPTEHPR